MPSFCSPQFRQNLPADSVPQDGHTNAATTLAAGSLIAARRGVPPDPSCGAAHAGDAEALSEVPLDGRGVEALAAQADVAIGPEQVVGAAAESPRARAPRSLAGSAGTTWTRMSSPAASAAAPSAGCPITIRLNRVSSSFSNRSSTGPSGRKLKCSQGKRSPACGACRGCGDADSDNGLLPVVDAGLRHGAKRSPLDSRAAHRERADPRDHLGAQNAGQRVVGDDEAKSLVGRVEQPPRDRHPLVLVRVDQRGARLSGHDERQLPCEIVGVLQARCSCLARRPGCGCAPHRPAGSNGRGESARRRDARCDRWRTTCIS